jgi:hypothetical protein
MTTFYSNGIRVYVDYWTKSITEEQGRCVEYDISGYYAIICSKLKIVFNILLALDLLLRLI